MKDVILKAKRTAFPSGNAAYSLCLPRKVSNAPAASRGTNGVFRDYIDRAPPLSGHAVPFPLSLCKRYTPTQTAAPQAENLPTAALSAFFSAR